MPSTDRGWGGHSYSIQRTKIREGENISCVLKVLSIKSDNCRATQENESNLRTKSSNQDKQFSIESLLGKEDCQNICIVSTNT